MEVHAPAAHAMHISMKASGGSLVAPVMMNRICLNLQKILNQTLDYLAKFQLLRIWMVWLLQFLRLSDLAIERGSSSFHVDLA